MEWRTTGKIRDLALDAGQKGEDEKAYYKTLPLIALSGDTSDETREKFMRAGLDDFTEKPVELGRLKKLLFKWLPAEMISSPDEERKDR